MRRALIVKTSSIGDVAHAFPIVEYLKREHGVERVGWVVEKKAASIVRAHPLVDVTIEIDSQAVRSLFPRPSMGREWWRQSAEIRAEAWDVVFDLQGNCKSGLVTLLARSPLKVGYSLHSASEWPNALATTLRFSPPKGLSIREEYLWIVQQFFQDTRSFSGTSVDLVLTDLQTKNLEKELLRWPISRPVWFIAVGSRWPSKMCSTTTVLEVLNHISEVFGAYFIFVAGTPGELQEVGTLAKHFSSSSHVLYQPDLPILHKAMNSAAAVVSVDSMILHLAATTEAPTFGLFGPSLASRYAPNGARHGWFQGSCAVQIPFDSRCPQLRTCLSCHCLKKVSPTRICDAIDQWQKTAPHTQPV